MDHMVGANQNPKVGANQNKSVRVTSNVLEQITSMLNFNNIRVSMSATEKMSDHPSKIL